MNLKPCGVAYWSITFSQVPLSIAFTLYVLYEKKKNCRQEEEGEVSRVDWHGSNLGID